ncbi:MAG: MBOAT family protein [Chloroflexi bacterium]|nr:MBOAT family protein [Chloroflexota bacterium]
MTITQIAMTGIGVILYRIFAKDWQKEKVIFVTNVFFLFLLQPATSIRYLDFILPFLTLLLILGVGIGLNTTSIKKDLPQVVLLIALGFLPFFLAEYLPFLQNSTLDKHINLIVLGWLILGSVAAIIFLLLARKQKKYLLWFIFLILLIFVFLKQPQLSTWLSKNVRFLFQQNTNTASGFDIRWFGYSYIAFRIIHVIREYQKGRLSQVPMLRFFNFCLFFPTLSAGPIAKYDDFSTQWEVAGTRDVADDIFQGSIRLFIGLFKKFVVADALALLALNTTNAGQIMSAGWVGLALLAYSLQIYFDFSGYTDIAIGLGLFLGIKLPENFKNPYMKSNLAKFWDSWHITLAQWIRAYYFNPVNRALRKSKRSGAQTSILFFTQVTTMMLIGLWHGITWTFLIWGLWHGLGLFIQNRWNSATKSMQARIQQKPWLDTFIKGFSTLGTFIYVSLGWVWFFSPSMQMAFLIFRKLIGKGAY